MSDLLAQGPLNKSGSILWSNLRSPECPRESYTEMTIALYMYYGL